MTRSKKKKKKEHPHHEPLGNVTLGQVLADPLGRFADMLSYHREEARRAISVGFARFSAGFERLAQQVPVPGQRAGKEHNRGHIDAAEKQKENRPHYPTFGDGQRYETEAEEEAPWEIEGGLGGVSRVSVTTTTSQDRSGNSGTHNCEGVFHPQNDIRVVWRRLKFGNILDHPPRRVEEPHDDGRRDGTDQELGVKTAHNPGARDCHAPTPSDVAAAVAHLDKYPRLRFEL